MITRFGRRKSDFLVPLAQQIAEAIQTSMTKITRGCTYRFDHLGETVQVKVVGYDPILKMHIVQRRGATHESRLDIKKLVASNRLAPCRTAVRKKSDSANCWLYICKVGHNTYKYGCTGNVDRRLKQIQTYCPNARFVSKTKIPAKRSANWSQYESKVLARFSSEGRAAGREVLRLDDQKLREVIDYTRRVIAA